jgi:hypothetical protein
MNNPPNATDQPTATLYSYFLDAIGHDDAMAQDEAGKFARYVMQDIRAGKLNGVALKTYDGSTCWACERCGKTRTGRGCMACLENDLADSRRQTEEARKERDAQWATNNRNADVYRDSIKATIADRDAMKSRCDEYEKAQQLMDGAEWEALKVLREAGVNSLVAIALPLSDGVRQVVKERDTATAALSQARGEWVSVKDRMPTEIDSVVLIARRSPSFGMKVESARYTADAFIGASAWWHHESYVTHWRPLPPPPTAQNGGAV